MLGDGMVSLGMVVCIVLCRNLKSWLKMVLVSCILLFILSVVEVNFKSPVLLWNCIFRFLWFLVMLLSW